MYALRGAGWRLTRGAAAALLVGATLTVLPADAAAPRLTVDITSPTSGATLSSSTIPIRGQIGGKRVAVLYVIDVSGSTDSPDGQDCNGDKVVDTADDVDDDGTIGDTLDCEAAGIIALNGSLSGRHNVDAGLIAFGDDAAAADVSSDAGDQTFVAPSFDGPDGGSRDRTADIVNVTQSVRRGGVGLFQDHEVGEGTDFDRPLAVAHDSFAKVAGEAQVVFFLSDGIASVNSGPGSTLDQLQRDGAVLNTYAIGDGTGAACAGSLGTIAGDPSRCYEVDDPADLVATIPTSNSDTSVSVTATQLPNGPTVGPVRATIDAAGGFEASLDVGTRAGQRTFRIDAVATQDEDRASTSVTITIGNKPFVYTALGDSFSAGEGIDPWINDRDGKACHRSPKAYSQLVQLPNDKKPLVKSAESVVRFVACSGAIMVNLFSKKQIARAGTVVNLQSAALSSDVDLVTVTIGGNDAGFAEILKFCASHYQCKDDTFVSLPDGSGGMRDYTLQQFLDLRLSGLLLELPAIYKQIQSMVRPDTQVIVAGYPHLLGVEGSCSENTAFPEREREWLYGEQERFEEGLTAATDVAGVTYASVMSEFAGHIPCSGLHLTAYLHGFDTAWNGAHWKFWKDIKSDDQSFHPTERGQRAYADVINRLVIPRSGQRGDTAAPGGRHTVPQAAAAASPDRALARAAARIQLDSLDLSDSREATNSETYRRPSCNGVASPGQTLLAHGAGFAPGSPVTITVHSQDGSIERSFRVVADDNGVVTTGVSAPDARAGSYVSVEAAGSAGTVARILQAAFVMDAARCGTGNRDDLSINAPRVANVGDSVRIAIDSRSTGQAAPARPLQVTISRDGAVRSTTMIVTGDDGHATIALTSAGEGIDEISVAPIVDGAPAAAEALADIEWRKDTIIVATGSATLQLIAVGIWTIVCGCYLQSVGGRYRRLRR